MLRRDDDADMSAEDDNLCIGCSMLSRIRMRPRQAGAMRVMRCSLGYALTTDDDVARCLAVEGPSACWKAGTPSWRVAPAVEEPVQPVDVRANGHMHPRVDALDVIAEASQLLPQTGDEVIEIELTIVEVVRDDV
jgi:hypothetical protein